MVTPRGNPGSGSLRPWTVAAILGAIDFDAGWFSLDRAGGCGSDFSAFFVGGKLNWRGLIHGKAAVRDLQRELLGCRGTGNSFIRLPSYAAALRISRSCGAMRAGALLALWTVKIHLLLWVPTLPC